MKSRLRIAITLILLLALVPSFGCARLRAKDRLNEGARAYNKGNYVEATRLFKESIDLSNDFPKAKIFYAASLRAQFSPGGESPENKALAEQAIKAYQDIIATSPDPADVDIAHTFIAELYNGLGNLEENRNWTLKRVQLKGQTDQVRSLSYYALAVTYWKESYDITQKYVIPRSQPLAYRVPEEWEAGDVEKARDAVMKGLQNMEESLKVNPNYADSYSYRNLLYKEQMKFETDPQIKSELADKAAKDEEEFQRLNRENQAGQQPQG
jgi:hypothetical protein